jgi:hypothetical protein
LQLALPAIVFDGRFGGFNRRGSLRNLCLIVIILKLDQEIARVHALIVRHLHVSHNASNFCAEGREIAAYKGIVGNLFDLASLPGIPIARERDQHGHGKHHHK